MLRGVSPPNPMGQGYWMEEFRGTTEADGTLSFTFQKPFSAISHVSIERLPPAPVNVTTRLTALSLTGLSLIAEARASLSVLSLNVLSFAVTPVSGQEVTIAVVGH